MVSLSNDTGVTRLCELSCHRHLADARPHRAPPVALQNGVDDAGGMIPVFEGRKRGRFRVSGTLSCGDEAVDVTQHVAKRVGPPLLMPAGQVCVPPGVWR